VPGAARAAAVRLAAALVVAGLLAAGCGGADGDGGGIDGARPLRDVTLLLDFTPNPVHTGIFSATAQGFDREAGLNLAVREPSASTDALKLLAAGRADLAVLDVHDLGLAREKGRDIVGVMALVQRPLAAVLAAPDVRSPSALEGKAAGVTGLPSDTAVLRSVVTGAGGDPGRVREVTIGFNAVAGLLSGRVAGATAFWNVEGVALRSKRPGSRIFRVDDYGAPAYPELVLCATRRTLRERQALVRDTLAVIARGYRFAIAHPALGLDDLLGRNPGLDRPLAKAQLAAVLPAFTAGAARFGELDPARLRAWAAWDVRFGILTRPPDVARAFDGSFLPR
jgi:ABC-type nitrate/sulfonate/bicarbonate transport system substrate-binding protein